MVARWLVLLVAYCVVGAAAGVERTIYRCTIAGVATFSDRPCGDSIQVHSLEVAPASAPAVPERRKVVTPPVRAPAGRRVPTQAQQNPRPKECVRLNAQLRRLSASMRAGYTAAAGERLREQQRELRTRHRELRCR